MDSPVLDAGTSTLTATPTFAGFGVRLLASIVDMLVLSPLIGASIYFTTFSPSFGAVAAVTLLSMLYKPVMEGLYGATVGKMVCKLKVVAAEFEQISMAQAWMRYVPWIIGSLFGLYVNYQLFSTPGFEDVDGFLEMGVFMQEASGKLGTLTTIQQLLGWLPLVSALFLLGNKRKQAAHDMLAETYVVRRDPNTL